MHFGAANNLVFRSHAERLARKCEIVGVQTLRQIHEDLVFGAQFLAGGRDVVHLALVVLLAMDVVVGAIDELSFPAELERFAVSRVGDRGRFVGFRRCESGGIRSERGGGCCRGRVDGWFGLLLRDGIDGRDDGCF